MNQMGYIDVLVTLVVSIRFCVGFNVSYNLPKFGRNATWNATGEIFANVSISSYPTGIFVDINDSIYVSYSVSPVHVSVWSNGSKIVTRNISTDSNADAYSVFTTLNGNTYFDNGANGSVDVWSVNNTTSSIKTLDGRGSCNGLFVDINNTLYCSITTLHKVIKRSLRGDNDNWILAGGDGSTGTLPNQLESPQGIFVDINFTLYVADCDRKIIQQFKPDSTSGIVLSNSGSNLNCPTDVVLDADGEMYVADNHQHRIVRVILGFSNVKCLVGCTGSEGSNLNQLHNPVGLSFDTMGNIYVTDTNNHRVLKFFLIDFFVALPWTSPRFILNMNIDQTTTETPTTTKENIISTSQSTSSESTLINHFTTNVYKSTKEMFSSSTSEIILSTTSVTSTMSTNVFSSSSAMAHSTDPDQTQCPSSNLLNLCVLLQPCKNSGTCTIVSNFSRGYHCICSTGYTGVHCEHYMSPCQLDSCLYQGTCIPKNSSNFYCLCTAERTGVRCEVLIHRCDEHPCLNRGVCQRLPLDYRCQCLTSEYWGRHCEHVSTRLLIRQYVSKGIGYVAILALVITVGFFIVMDGLKYIFGIDPVRGERDAIRRGRALLERRGRKRRKRPAISCC